MGQINLSPSATSNPVRQANGGVLPLTPQSPTLQLQGTPAPEAWTPSGGKALKTETGVVLEHAESGFTKPNVLDVKLGSRLWADDAPPAKRAKMEKDAAETTSGALGFRITGMKTWQGPDAVGQEGITPEGYKLCNEKKCGRNLTAEDVQEGFHEYFTLDRKGKVKEKMKKVVKRFIEDLEQLQEVMQNLESRMYSTSLLFVYEGDADALQEAFKQEDDLATAFEYTATNGTRSLNSDGPVDDDSDIDCEVSESHPIQKLKLIDFAHAQWTPGKGPDENMLRGMRNVTKILNEICV